ncbi:MAG: FimB/Mfa2 family fimbrial subunit [Tannerella sp.]|jgi:hypothetical protein|nr:FimB/Mfa2 family fimbrial subunit [Tannerella sp.]
MECYKKIGLLFCAAIFLLQGCVINDLDDCPDAIRYALAFEYTLHTGENDRFAEDVDKMFIYAFDATTGICVYADTTTLIAPFGKDYTYSLPLSMGKYDIITWGWGRNTGDVSLKMSTAVIPTIIPGTTSIDNARLLLEDKLNDGRLERTFYGERNVDVPAFVSRVDTVSLINITNQIRIIIPDAKTAEIQDRISVSIVGNNGAYYFKPGSNPPAMDVLKGGVTYLPYVMYRTDSVLVVDPISKETYTGTGRDSMLIVEISTLRLVQNDANMQVVLDYGGNPVIFPLLEMLQAGISSNIQYNLDKYYRWQLLFNITNTSVTVHIQTMDWHVVYQPSNAGGILQ